MVYVCANKSFIVSNLNGSVIRKADEIEHYDSI